MGVFRSLSGLILRQVLVDQADALLGLLGERFADNSRRLEGALSRSAERAWRALEVALAGPTLWQGACDLIGSRDDKLLRRQVQTFLDRMPGCPGPFRLECLKELRGARRVKLVPGNVPGAFEVDGDFAAFARSLEPARVLEHDNRLMAGIAEELRREGYPLLARYVELRPGGRETLLTWAARYFFRREVEGDARLSAALTLDRLDGAKDELARLQAMFESRLATQQEELRRVNGMLQQLLERQPPTPPPAAPARKRLISELFDEGE
ncbi:MAG: hypothetical protein ACRC33_16000 [Gemmataceae bacterium]